MNIKKIIKEEIDDFDWVDQSGVETPLSWLIDNYGDLTPVVRGNKTFHVDGNHKRLFYYENDTNWYCYISYYKIWEVLMTRFGIEYGEIQKVIIIWLEDVYGITGRTPKITHNPKDVIVR